MSAPALRSLAQALFFVLLAALLCPLASAQTGAPDNHFAQDIQEQTHARPQEGGLPTAEQLAAPQACTADPELCHAWAQYRIAYYQRIQALGQIQVDQYRRQMLYSDWIMFVVLLLVLGGLAFSGAQLWVALRTGRSIATGDIDAQIGGGIVVKTSAMGISVLTISLIFFYLLLRSVYAIVPAGGS